MSWRYGRWTVEHALPFGASEHVSVGDRVDAGDALASGTTVGTAIRVEVARRVGLDASEVAGALRVRVGQRVLRGAILARSAGRFSRAAVAPVDGRVVHLGVEGDVFVAPELDAWRVRSTLAGVVARADDAVVTVLGEAWCLQGLAAYGPDAVGTLALGVDAPLDELLPSRIDVGLRGTVLLGGSRIAAEAVTRAHACGVAAVIAGAAPAGGLRTVFGDDVDAGGLSARDDRPTVLCLVGFGTAPLPLAVFRPATLLAGSPASIHTASARLFVQAASDAIVVETAPDLALADDHAGVRLFEATRPTVTPTRFASGVVADAIVADGGAVPLANVLPFDAPR